MDEFSAHGAQDGSVGTDEGVGFGTDSQVADNAHGVGVAAAGCNDDFNARCVGGVESGAIARAYLAFAVEEGAVDVDGNEAGEGHCPSGYRSLFGGYRRARGFPSIAWKLMPKIAFLECARCGHKVSADVPQTLCPVDAGSLYVRYDMEELRADGAERAACGAGGMVGSEPGDVALSRGAARRRAGDSGRGMDAHGAVQALSGVVDQGRRCESDRNLQGAGAGTCRDDGAAVWLAASGGALGGQCGGRSGGLCGGCGASRPTSLCRRMCRWRIIWRASCMGPIFHMIDGLISDCARLVSEEIKRQKEARYPQRRMLGSTSLP